ncbi:hypothetical protein DSO57_1034464 [Entomophthora muscae]|uniref:Uncharacterized protein n=1 Tax=Entomophthora muscae TaxID=34485 RepID=A0ACC2UKH4_9FUNG|nr:hypothetical protein DSO57_1034464 [Entomophthora muscae]
MPDTGGLLGKMHKFLNESYSKLPQSPGGGTEPEEAPNTQINKQKDLKSSHPKAASGKLPVPSATLLSKTPNANPPKPGKLYQEVKPGSVPEYKEYTANNILAWDPLARTTELTRYNQKGPWYVIKPHLFRDKYNFLPAYQLDMELPVTFKPMPASAAELPLDHAKKLFGIVYITLTGVIDTIVPAAGPWLWVGKSMSYLIKLAPILWWALPTQSATCQFPNASKQADQGTRGTTSSYFLVLIQWQTKVNTTNIWHHIIWELQDMVVQLHKGKQKLPSVKRQPSHLKNKKQTQWLSNPSTYPPYRSNWEAEEFGQLY